MARKPRLLKIISQDFLSKEFDPQPLKDFMTPILQELSKDSNFMVEGALLYSSITTLPLKPESETNHDEQITRTIRAALV